MNLEVRISIETAELFEELRNYYKKTIGLNLSKSDILIKAISYATNNWEEIDWKYVNEKKIKVDKYDISQASLRPKLQVTLEAKEKLIELKNILPQILEIRSVTLGVCMKLILKFALLERELKQEDKNIKIDRILNKNKSKYIAELYSEKAKSDSEKLLCIKKLVMNILLELDN